LTKPLQSASAIDRTPMRAAPAALTVDLDQPLPKAFMHGTHRAVAPDETLARVKPFASAMGITRIGNITGLDHIGIPVAVAVRPKSRSVSVSQGKGISVAHAMASALMESAELFHAEDLLRHARFESFRKLASEARVVNPETLNRTGDLLRAHNVIPWIKGYDLRRGETCWVPAETVHADDTESESDGLGHFLAGSNGLASGNHHLEALSGAICELVERDAIALWHCGGLRQRTARRLEPATIDDETCRDLLDRYERAGIAVRLWDITSDLGIPVYLCDIRARAENPSVISRRFRGAGCHASRAVALSRALTEAAQVRLTHIVGIRDDIFPDAYAESLAERTGAALLDVLARSTASRSFLDAPSFDSPDIAADVRWLLDRLRTAGIESLVAVDLTDPGFGIPVVRAIVPGLEGDCTHPAYVPGPRARLAGLFAG
jgi:ribosomal protein S12 methylthiotransferase accessory factor